MKRLLAASVWVVLVVLAVPVYGQQQAGDLELQFMGSYYRTIGTGGTSYGGYTYSYSSGSGTISGKIGPYITDNIQFGLGPSLTISHNGQTVTEDRTGKTLQDTTTVTTTFGTYAFVVYSFLSRSGKLVPYLGAQYFKQHFSKPWSEEPGSVGFSGGVKYFFAKKTALDVQANYLFDMNENAEGGYLLFAVGLSFLL